MLRVRGDYNEQCVTRNRKAVDSVRTKAHAIRTSPLPSQEDWQLSEAFRGTLVLTARRFTEQAPHLSVCFDYTMSISREADFVQARPPRSFVHSGHKVRISPSSSSRALNAAVRSRLWIWSRESVIVELRRKWNRARLHLAASYYGFSAR